jgi:hypothetical protein
MSDDEQEIAQLEATFAGKQPPRLRPEAAAGRLAELYLSATGRPERFPAARNLAQAALDRVGRDDPLWPKLAHQLARALRAGGAPELATDAAWSQAAALDRDSWLLNLDPVPQEALGAARDWGAAAWDAERWGEAADAYHGAEIALARLVRRETIGLDARIELLSSLSDQAPRAAYACARAERPEDAIILLERAATLLTYYGEQTRDRADLVAAGHSDLNDQLQAAVEAVAATAATADALGRRSPARLAAQATNDALVRQIRNVPGFSSFAAPASWDDVREAATGTALAYLAATDKGTVILVVPLGAQSVSYSCPSATLAEVMTAARPFLNREFDDDLGDVRPALADLLRWLGENLILAVHKSLGGDHRVTLLPFGLLALLPLQAGLIMMPPADGQPARPHVLFHPANVSYAYSARSLHRSARRPAPSAPGTALVVSNPLPLPPEYDPLLLSEFERDAVARYFTVRELAGRAADPGAVLTGLPGADLAHFSCHGSVDPARHYTGILLLSGRTIITAEHFARTADLTARLIVLSACRSGAAAVGPATVTGLPAMLIAAGARAVLGTFWHTDEMATLLLVSKFYELWVGGKGQQATAALGQALAWLILTPAAVLRAACPPAALASPAGAELAAAPEAARPYNDPWYWAAFFLVGEA